MATQNTQLLQQIQEYKKQLEAGRQERYCLEDQMLSMQEEYNSMNESRTTTSLLSSDLVPVQKTISLLQNSYSSLRLDICRQRMEMNESCAAIVSKISSFKVDDKVNAIKKYITQCPTTVSKVRPH